MVPDWDDTVASMIKEYPEKFRDDQQYAKSVIEYQAISKEHALRQKEELAEKQNPTPVRDDFDNEMVRSPAMDGK
ncbi:hypothetical protein D3C72_2370920 [compost metagenome]